MDEYILSKRKEVDFVSTRNRKNVVKKDLFKFLKKKKENNKKKEIRHKDKSKEKSIKNSKENNNRRKIEAKKKDKKLVVKKKDKTANRRDENKKQKKKKSFLRTLLTIFLSLCILGIFSIAAFMVFIVATTEEFDPEALKNQDQTIIYDKDGNEIAKLGNEKRESISYDDLPQVLIDAIIATEDSRFYEHNGVDMARFIKASVFQLMGKNDAGGASTLTMQVVKNNLTSTTSSGIKGIIRKFKDVYISVFFMEKKYTKNEIIEMYVNDSGLGGMIYGVEEASNYYFGKTASELSLPEAALLAGKV